MIELQSLGRVKREQSYRGTLVEIVHVTDQSGAIQKVGKSLATLAAFRDSIHQFVQIFRARCIFGRASLLQHFEIPGKAEDGGYKLRRRELLLLLRQIDKQFAEAAQRS